MKKIAIPITENNKIEAHFGHSKFYEIYTFSNTNEIVDLQLLDIVPSVECKSNIINVLVKEGVACMLFNNVGNRAIYKFKEAGINIIRGCTGNSADIILDFIDGKITDKEVFCSKFC